MIYRLFYIESSTQIVLDGMLSLECSLKNIYTARNPYWNSAGIEPGNRKGPGCQSKHYV